MCRKVAEDSTGCKVTVLKNTELIVATCLLPSHSKVCVEKLLNQTCRDSHRS